ncbi:MAG: hypothetical protein H6621_04775 [Halobacteriovoraceae bacterium]|nr:hypothetical protein [Halobacteriovoraceae bacterium]
MKKSILIILLTFSSVLSARDNFNFSFKLGFPSSYGVKVPNPNLNNPISDVGLSGYSSGNPYGGAMSIGMEFLGNQVLSLFTALNFDYQKTTSGSPGKNHVVTSKGNPTTYYQTKTRLIDNTAELGINVNFHQTDFLIQPYISAELGNLSRFDRISLKTEDKSQFGRESETSFDLTKINLGIRFIGSLGYFSDFKISQTSLSQTHQKNSYQINASYVDDHNQYYNTDEYTSYYTVYLGLGLFF